MDRAFLKTRISLRGQQGRIAMRLSGFSAFPRAAGLARFLMLAFLGAIPIGCLFDDPIEELDPALLEDASFDTLPPSESFRVARGHILESFGAFNCSSCPDAESRLSRYIHPGADPSAYNPNLVVVNYHVKFDKVIGTWVTPATQARHDQFGFTSLPQVKMNGANAPYGIREKDVRFAQGEYDTLIRRLNRVDSLTWLDLRIDTVHYDTASRFLTARFRAFNRSSSATGGMSFRVLAVKNRPVVTSTPLNHGWEVIVAETTDRDSSGRTMTLPGMAGLRAKTWVAVLEIPPETERQPPPSNPENPANYAIVAFVRDAAGVVQNVTTRNFAPEQVP